MASLRASEAAAAAAGRVVAGDAQALLSGAAIDSRAVRGGELFFAFAGAHADGHRFVGDAFGRGAAGAVVQDLAAAAASWPPLAETLPAAPPVTAGATAGAPAVPPELAGRAVIQVADTLAALHDVARSVRRRVPRRLVGITGSAGKTTTKELLAAMLAARYRVARNPGNFNNLYGFPLALLNVPDDAEWMVAEMGMSTPGELRQLSLLGRPDVALFTVVRPAHLQSFDNLRGIAEAKAELLAGLAPDGMVVANAGDPEVVRIARRYLAEGAGGSPGGPDTPRKRVVWYGIAPAAGLPATAAGAAGSPGAGAANSASAAAADTSGADSAPPALPPPLDVVAYDLAVAPGGIGSRFVLAAGGQAQEVLLPLHGLYNVENCVAAAACAFALGVPLPDIAAAAAQARPAAGRGVLHRVALPGGPARLTVIDDSYNSNPDALAKALASAARLPAARRLAVLGDMLELGPAGPRFHREGGVEAARLGFDPVAGVGELARELVAGVREGGAAAAWHPDAGAAADWVAAAVRPGDVVLVKGSRGVGLDAVVRRLLAMGEAG
ncbi:MAG TPA: Mur ligase family protein [Thermoanaerobaculia bacterium]|nr:Mur ligase family protein [Thermoanaerobaculia bacterium]